MATIVRKRKVKAPEQTYPWPLVLHVRPTLDLSEDQFLQLCQLNRDLQIERTAEGDWSIMTPVAGSGGDREAEIVVTVRLHRYADGGGQLREPLTNAIRCVATDRVAVADPRRSALLRC